MGGAGAVILSLYLTQAGSRFWTASTAVDLADAIARAAEFGYDAVEVMPRAVDDPDPARLRALADRRGVKVLALATGFIALEHGVTLTDPDPEVRRRAVRGVEQCLQAARRAGAALVSIGLIRGKLHAGLSRQQALAHLTACLRECGRQAGNLGLTLAVEPGNRYETDFIHTVADGVALIEDVGVPSVRLMVDTFHMNIEEVSLKDAIGQAGPHLAHVHFADSNRRAPGWGHLDFAEVRSALRAVEYDRAVGLEIALTPDFDAAARQGAQFVRQLFAAD